MRRPKFVQLSTMTIITDKNKMVDKPCLIYGGCGCCEGKEPLTVYNLTQAIKETKKFLTQLEKAKAKLTT